MDESLKQGVFCEGDLSEMKLLIIVLFNIKQFERNE